MTKDKRFGYIKEHQKDIFIFCSIILSILVFFVLGSYLIIGANSKYIKDYDQIGDVDSYTAVVLGGGIENGKPRPLIKERLNAAADLLEQGKVKKLIVSGDNRYLDYNEPQAMKNYLVEQRRIDPAKIQLDNAGRSTYETCERAIKVFNQNKLILVSESTHLPRAIYLCRSFGIEAYGYKSDRKSASGLLSYQLFREIFARTKATFNVYVIGEKTILGNKIPI